MCGQRVGRAQPKADEVSSLRALRRGVYARTRHRGWEMASLLIRLLRFSC